MNKLTIAIVSGFLGVLLLIAFMATARSMGKSSVYSKRDKPILRKIEKLKEQHPEGRAKAETGNTEFTFGTLNPGDSGKHSFVIRNTGFAPLALQEGPTTCKCTMS